MIIKNGNGDSGPSKTLGSSMCQNMPSSRPPSIWQLVRSLGSPSCNMLPLCLVSSTQNMHVTFRNGPNQHHGKLFFVHIDANPSKYRRNWHSSRFGAVGMMCSDFLFRPATPPAQQDVVSHHHFSIHVYTYKYTLEGPKKTREMWFNRN